MTLPNSMEMVEFLSTPSARRATGGAVRLCMRSGISIHALREEGDMGLIPPFCTMSHFYPRPPRGGRPFPPPSGMSAKRISIHALREEGDKADMITTGRYWHFYPRPPRGGRPGQYGQLPDP